MPMQLAAPPSVASLMNATQLVAPAPVVTLTSAEVFTVEVPRHVWVPGSYGRLARSFIDEFAHRGEFAGRELRQPFS